MLDGYKPTKGDFPRSFTPQIALYSQGRDNASTLSQNPFIVDTAGEFEIKDVIVYAMASPTGSLVFKINAENMNLAHLGRLNKKLENGHLEKIGNADILFVPVGGGEYLDAEDAAQLTTALEPRAIIPLAHQCDTDPGAAPLAGFIKEIGLKPDITDKKIIVKKKDLPQEEMKLWVLEKNY